MMRDVQVNISIEIEGSLARLHVLHEECAPCSHQSKPPPPCMHLASKRDQGEYSANNVDHQYTELIHSRF